MSKKGFTKYLVLKDMKVSKDKQGLIVVLSRVYLEEIAPKAEPAPDEIPKDKIKQFMKRFESNISPLESRILSLLHVKIDNELLAMHQRKIAAIAGIPSRMVQVEVDGIKIKGRVPDTILKSEENPKLVMETISRTTIQAFSPTQINFENWSPLPTTIQLQRWFESRFKNEDASLIIHENSLEDDEIYFEADTRQLHGKVIRKEKFWEKLRIMVSIRVVVWKKPRVVDGKLLKENGKVVYDTIRKIRTRMSLDGQYASGHSSPRLDRYKDMEPEYVAALINYMKPLANSLASDLSKRQGAFKMKNKKVENK